MSSEYSDKSDQTEPQQAHAESIQVHHDGDATTLVIDGEETRLPGARVDISLQEGGPLTVFISAHLTTDRVEVGGPHGS